MEKGEYSKNQIIASATSIFNREGLRITLNRLAGQMGVSRGRINHFFPTKERLFLAIAQAYEEERQKLNDDNQHPTQELPLRSHQHYFSALLDLQYRYQSAIVYILSSCLDSQGVVQHTHKTYEQGRRNVRREIERLVRKDVLSSRLLEEATFDGFFFQFTALFSAWIFHFRLYGHRLEFEQAKPLYLRWILELYRPFLTEEGVRQMDLLYPEEG